MKENDQKCEPLRTQITDTTDQWCPQLGTWQNTVLQMFFLGVLLSACERCIQEQGRPRVLKQVCLGVARYRRAVFCIGDGFCNLPWRQFPWTRAALLPKIRSTFITAGEGVERCSWTSLGWFFNSQTPVSLHTPRPQYYW